MNRLIFQFLILLVSVGMYAQQPTHATGSNNNEAIDLTNWVDILLFIVFPITLVFVYIMWRRVVKREKEQEQKETKED